MHPMLVHPYFRGKGVLFWEVADLNLSLVNGCTSWTGVSRVQGLSFWSPLYVSQGGFVPDGVQSLEVFCDYIVAAVDATLDAQKVEFDGGPHTRDELLRLLGSAVILAPANAFGLTVTSFGKSWIYVS